MRDMLPPIFQILTGLSFASLLVIGLLARRSFSELAGKLTGFAIVLSTAGLFLLSRATGATSIGAGGELFVGAGASFLAAVVVLTAALFIKARSGQARETSGQ